MAHGLDLSSESISGSNQDRERAGRSPADGNVRIVQHSERGPQAPLGPVRQAGERDLAKRSRRESLTGRCKLKRKDLDPISWRSVYPSECAAE